MERPPKAYPEAKKHTMVLVNPDIDATISYADQELLEAAAVGDIARVNRAAVANLNCSDLLGRTPLFIAAGNGHGEVVKLLLGLLLGKGVNIDATDNNGATALYIAALNGHEEIVRMLLEKGANVEIAPKHGGTPLYIAAQQGHEEIVKLLLDKGANTKVTCQRGCNSQMTPLDIATINNHLAVAQLLRTYSAVVIPTHLSLLHSRL